MNKIGILYHPRVEATRAKAKELKGFLESRGVDVWLSSSWERDKARGQLPGTELILTVGGDGTILRAAQVVIFGPVPITGVNMGRLGFMTELNAGEAIEEVKALLDGKGWIDERAMLQAELVTPDKAPQVFHALNDIVLARGQVVRAINVAATVNGEPLATYKTDGVIAATATGSTGYALAAQGPILYPQSKDFLLVPIAPHLTLSRALVLPFDAKLKLRVESVHPGVLSIDGHINLPVSSGDTVNVKVSQERLRFLRVQPAGSFYRSLEDKLKGNGVSDRKS